MDWNLLLENWDKAFAVFGVLVTAASAIVKIIPYGKSQGWVGIAIKALDFLSVVNTKLDEIRIDQAKKTEPSV